MNLTVASVVMKDMKPIFKLADYDGEEWQDKYFYSYIANKMGYSINELKNNLHNKFNGVIHKEFSDVYFEDIKDAKEALKWVEAMIVANKLKGKPKSLFFDYENLKLYNLNKDVKIRFL